MDTQQHPVLLYDGVCNLCNASVQWIIKHDPEGVFRFAALQSAVGQQLLSQYQQTALTNLSTVVLIDSSKVYVRSDAAIRIASRLGGIWSLMCVFWVVPRFVRDRVYNWIAGNRYKWFGEKSACMIPTPDIRSRFLDFS